MCDMMILTYDVFLLPKSCLSGDRRRAHTQQSEETKLAQNETQTSPGDAITGRKWTSKWPRQQHTWQAVPVLMQIDLVLVCSP